MRERTTTTVAACGLLLAGFAGPVQADHRLLHDQPQGPAPAHFPEDFTPPTDEEWGFPIGGFGGSHRGATAARPPVIFVHGNTTDHADWYPARDDFLAAGWNEQELWGLSYNGLGSDTGDSDARPNPEAEQERREAGWDGDSRSTSNEVNVPDLHAFIEHVRDYTGHDRFSIVSHSLGVTLARRTLQVHPELQQQLVAFVGIAGANHGTTLCPPGSEPLVVSCDEIAAGTAWLEHLNGPEGELETYPPAQWLTISDGSGLGDVAFVGPTYAQSPHLEGADNRTFPGTDHNDLRLDEAIVREYREFIEAAVDGAGDPVQVPETTEDVEHEEQDETTDGAPDTTPRDAAPPASPDDAASAPEAVPALPATGGGHTPLAVLLLALGSLTVARRTTTHP